MAKRKAKPQSTEPPPAEQSARSADEQALLAAVIAHPDEDTPRLMYADWLQENGQPERAEFIRAQIEATRFPPGDPNTKALRSRVVELAEKYRKQWCDGDAEVFVRGFPAATHFYDLNQFCDQAEGLFSRHPIRVLYTHEAFDRETEGEVAVVSSPHFARLTCLGSTSRGWDGDRVTKVLTNPHLANLRMLDFFTAFYTRTEGAQGIAAATHLTNLLVLDLSANKIGDEGLEALAGSRHLASLRALRLGRALSDGANDITEKGIAALARSQCFPSLSQLALDGNEVGTAGVERLLQTEWIVNLTELDLAHSQVSERGLLALARSHRLTNLRRLDVAANEVTEAVALAFLQSESLPNLTDLHLIGHDRLEGALTEATQTALRERFGPGVMSERNYHGYHAPTSLCIEDKVRWRMKHPTYTPPEPIDDCDAV